MFQKASEGIDYELIPSEQENFDQAWDVRLLTDYPETVIRFGNIAVNEEEDCLNFSFVLVSTPDDSLNEDVLEFQDKAASVLESILENAAAEGGLVVDERTTNENRTGTSDSEESDYE